MPNFYRKHRKLLTVLMVAVFAVGGILNFKVLFVIAEGVDIQVVPQAQLGQFQAAWDQAHSVPSAESSLGIPSAVSLLGRDQLSAYTNQQLMDYATQMGYFASHGFSEVTQKELFDLIGTNTGVRDQFVTDLSTLSKTGGLTGAAVHAGVNQQPSVVGQLESILGSMIAWFLYYIAVGLGWIMMLITKVMLIIGVFNSFLTQPAVQVGWTITRDICNNFFIIFMMIMAAGVTLHLQSYAWRTMLPKILIFAVVINFSMTITGVLIDVSQILMLTFASPLSTVQGYNIIISAFGLPDAFSMTKVIDQWKNSGTNGQITNTNGVSFYDIIAALLFAIIVTIVAIVVITCITVILVYRIIMLMFLVILSPLYFLTLAAPNISALGQVSSEWMGRLGKMLIVGPAMMFFLYLSFMTMAAVNNLNPADGTKQQSMLDDKVMNQAIVDNSNLTPGNGTTNSAIKPQGPQSAKPNIALTSQDDYSALSKMASVQGVINFLIVVGLLWVSLMMGQKFGEAAGKVAGSGMGMLKSGAMKYSGFNLGKKGVAQLQKAPGVIVKGVGAKVGTGALGITSVATGALGKMFGSQGVGLQKLGAVGSQWRQDVLGARRKARIAKLGKAMGKIGLGSDEVKQKWGEFTDTDLAKRTKAVALGAGALAAAGGVALATGGVGLMPALGMAAAGYVGGGGRLAEIALGQKGIARAKAREEEQKRIDAAKKGTEQIISDSAASRDKKIEERGKTLATHKDAEDAQKDIDQIEGLRPKNGKIDKTKGNIPNDFYDFLQKSKGTDGKAWMSGNNIIDEDRLKQAKEAFKKETSYTDRTAKIASHEANMESIKSTEEAVHKSRIYDMLDNSKVGKTQEEQSLIDAEKVRLSTESTVKTALDLTIGKIEAKLTADLASIDATADPESKKIFDRRRAQENHDEALSTANAASANAIAAAQPQASKPRALDKFLEDYKPYAHENWVSQGVAKDAQKMQQAIKDLVAVMEDAGSDLLSGFDQISKGSFYSGNGQTETQYRSIKAMTDSTTAIKNLIDALSKMKDNPKGQEAQLVKELKQGIAAYHKGGGDISKLAAVIALLDKKKGMNNENKIIDDKTVSDYEEKIKPKK